MHGVHLTQFPISGICGTDLHTLSSGWYPTDYPTCVGHEYVRTMSNFTFHIIHPFRPVHKYCKSTRRLTTTKIQTRRLNHQSWRQSFPRASSRPDRRRRRTSWLSVSFSLFTVVFPSSFLHVQKIQLQESPSNIGSAACADCEECTSGLENYCSNLIPTYNGRYANGERCMGGYANYWRGPGAFVFRIPDGMPPAEAAPMLCAGVSVYFPLKTHGCGPGKKVGIIGIGGLGHFGILFAKALGADKVFAISRYNSTSASGASKRDDALRLGADEFIATEDEPGWETKHARSLDLIISTVASPKMPILSYLSLLRVNGTLIQLGAPEDTLPPLNAHWLIGKGVKLGGSLIGPPSVIREMLELAVEKRVRPIVQERRMKDANQALLDMQNGLARYRYVLVNEDDEEGGRQEAKL
ncbi:NAD(P)-binding protein [Xylona heveae TC161]|uniref:alcohol dehydrogenase (NADP(+)) n=1 Tax=Xylona heveae (strain CBS 132557 / TC161) TaxID=1328760 RepID=A0A164ZIC5_XYLHT|nr:NAD(P)-binding protein [Xylona heveae TC161]KZF19134.1 NAD(P)-binding protein [Xylona heveae TC161]